MGLQSVFPMIVVDKGVSAQHGQRIDSHSTGRLASLGVCTFWVLNRFKPAFVEEMQAEKQNTARPTGRHACGEEEARGWGYGIGKPQDAPVGSDC